MTTTFTGTVVSISISKSSQYSPLAGEYEITIAPDGGGSNVSFSGTARASMPEKGKKVTYWGTMGTDGKMLYTLYKN